MTSRAWRLLSGLVSALLVVALAPSVVHAVDEPTPEQQIDEDGYAGLDGLAGLFADPAPETKSDSQGAASTTADMVKDMASSIGADLFAGVVAYGINDLFNLLFPGPNYAQMLQGIQASLADEQQSLNEVSQQLDGIAASIASDAALSAQGVCATAMAEANTRVETINLALTNYVDTKDANWVAQNLPDEGGVDGFRIVGNQVFGTSGSTSPTFLSGLNQVALATQDLGSLLTRSAGGVSGGLLAACADASAADVTSSIINAGNSSSPNAIGVAETAYFERLQQLTAYYTSWINVGTTLSLMGGYMATAITDPSPPASLTQAQTLCRNVTPGSTWNALTCAGALAIAKISRANVNTAWDATGAGWAQATGGVLGTALGVPAAGSAGGTSPSGVFTDSGTVWVRDIAQYGQRLSRQPSPLPDSTSSPATLNSLAPVSTGTPAQYSSSGKRTSPAAVTMKTNKWLGGTFRPATAANWDALLNLTRQPLFPGADQATAGQAQDCLPGYQNSGSATKNCASPTIGSLIAQTGLVNGGQAPTNMIFYTGETIPFQINNSSAVTYLRGSAGNYTDAFPKDWTVPTWTVATYLDTNSKTMNGFSAVNNPPAAIAAGDSSGAATVPGYFTPASLYPYVSANTADTKGGSIWTITMSNNSTQAAAATGSSGTYPFALVACSDGSGGFPIAQSPWSLSQLFTGTYNLNCGEWNYVTPSKVPGIESGLPVTTNASFYTPLTQMYFQGDTGLAEQWDFCANASKECPANPTWTDSGNYPGWLLDGGWYGTKNGSGSNTWAVTPQPQTQFMWPVLDTAATCGSGGMTRFTQGVTGSINAPNMCVTLFHDFISRAYGADFGTVSLTVDAGMTAAKESYAGVSLYNSSSTTLSAKLLIEPSSSVSLDPNALRDGGVIPTNGASATGCQRIAGNDWTCTVSIPPGSSGLAFPATLAKGASGSLTVTAWQGTNVASDTSRVVQGKPSAILKIPGRLSNVTVTAAGASSADRPTLSWSTPVLAAVGALDGYNITAARSTKGVPTGTTYTQRVPVSKVTLSDDESVSSITLPASAQPEFGEWTVTINAFNSVGTGPSTYVTTKYGASAPSAVTNLTAVQYPNGAVRLDWDPVDAVPDVSSYTVTATSPTGKAITPIEVTTTGYLTTTALSDGDWVFGVFATNSVGKGPTSTTPLKVTGAIPAEPSEVMATVNAIGQINVTWHAPVATVIPPTRYNVAIYAPMVGSASQSTTPIAQYVIPVSGRQSIVSLPAAFQLGRNSAIGSYTVHVWAENALGVGPSRWATVYVTPLLTRTLANELQLAAGIEAAAVLLQDLEYAACTKGVNDVAFQTGACRADGTWVPLPGFLPTALAAGATRTAGGGNTAATFRSSNVESVVFSQGIPCATYPYKQLMKYVKATNSNPVVNGRGQPVNDYVFTAANNFQDLYSFNACGGNVNASGNYAWSHFRNFRMTFPDLGVTVPLGDPGTGAAYQTFPPVTATGLPSGTHRVQISSDMKCDGSGPAPCKPVTVTDEWSITLE